MIQIDCQEGINDATLDWQGVIEEVIFHSFIHSFNTVHVSGTVLGTGDSWSEETKVSALRKLTFKGKDTGMKKKPCKIYEKSVSAQKRALRSTQAGGDAIYVSQGRTH